METHKGRSSQPTHEGARFQNKTGSRETINWTGLTDTKLDPGVQDMTFAMDGTVCVCVVGSTRMRKYHLAFPHISSPALVGYLQVRSFCKKNFEPQLQFERPLCSCYSAGQMHFIFNSVRSNGPAPQTKFLPKWPEQYYAQEACVFSSLSGSLFKASLYGLRHFYCVDTMNHSGELVCVASVSEFMRRWFRRSTWPTRRRLIAICWPIGAPVPACSVVPPPCLQWSPVRRNARGETSRRVA